MTADSDAGSAPAGLAGTASPLVSAHDVLLVDLDGVAYAGDRPIDGAAEALTAARDGGTRIVFVTNNASRPPEEVADQLRSMGVAAQVSEVMTSAIAAAGELARRFPTGTAILVVGGAGVRDALLAVGLRPVTGAAEEPAAVLQGFAPEVGWTALAEASVALRAGAVWVATNADLTLPSPRGPLPGNGSLVAALAAATGMQPEVIGKPGPALFEAAIRATSATAPLAVGDRLDTDIAGARAAGLPSLLVLSGVSGPIDLLEASPSERPDYIGRDLRALSLSHPAATVEQGTATCGSASATVTAGSIELSGGGSGSDGLDGIRVLCALAWSGATDGLTDRAAAYQQAVESLNLNL